MTAATESARLPRMSDGPEEPITSRTIPIITPTIQMSAPSPGDPMEITTPTTSSPPASGSKTPEQEANGPPISTTSSTGNTPTANGTSGLARSSPGSPAEITPKTESQPSASASTPGGTTSSMPTAAAPAVHQPKIVQTAFIHKLYNMLEDPNIQHLISWSSSAESFVMSPSHDFSKVLAQYFKHTNISSFVRQLNMYGFHKVSDVFANGSDSTTLWEFKHGNGNFKRGDLVGLREIKRRASRHSLVHREYNSQKPPPPSQPGTPAEAIPIPDGGDPRVTNVEHALYTFDSRIQRTEEMIQFMQMKNQAAMDTISRLLQFNQELSRAVLNLVPNADSPIHRDVVNLQGEIQRQIEAVRALDEPHEPPFSGSRQFFSAVDNAPVSPRQMPQDDSRRPNNLTVPQARQSNFYRPPVPSHLSISTRRPYGSIGGGTTQSSPSSGRSAHLPPPPVPQVPLAVVEPSMSSLGRRHTSADIRAHGWQPSGPQFPPGPGPVPPSQFPPSPNRLGAMGPEDQRIRDSFSAYSLQSASQPHSRPATPPPPPPFANGNSNSNGGGPDLGNWSWAAANRSANNLSIKDSSAPPTRRGSMAHILNPTDTAEREDEDGSPRDDDRKRKRII